MVTSVSCALGVTPGQGLATHPLSKSPLLSISGSGLQQGATQRCSHHHQATQGSGRDMHALLLGSTDALWGAAAPQNSRGN